MVQMMLGRGSIASRPLRYRNQIISANCRVCGISNTYTIPVDLDQDFEDTKMERDTTNDSLDFNPASHSHTPDYHRLLPALHAFARLPSPHQAYSVGHPFTLYEVLSAEYNLRYGILFLKCEQFKEDIYLSEQNIINYSFCLTPDKT